MVKRSAAKLEMEQHVCVLRGKPGSLGEAGWKREVRAGSDTEGQVWDTPPPPAVAGNWGRSVIRPKENGAVLRVLLHRLFTRDSNLDHRQCSQTRNAAADRSVEFIINVLNQTSSAWHAEHQAVQW